MLVTLYDNLLKNRTVKTTYTKEKLRVAVGAKIKAIREKQGLSQDALGQQANSSDKYISKLEHGKTNVGIDKLFEIGMALKTPVASFFK